MITIKEASLFCRDGDWIESKDQSSSGIRLIQTGNIGVGVYLDKFSRAKYISEETFNKLECTEVFPGDIIVSRLPAPVGRACIVPDGLGRTIAAVDCTILRIDEKKFLKEYVLLYTETGQYKSQIEKFLAGSTRVRISRKNLESISIPQKNLETQKSIVSRIYNIKNIIELRKQQLSKLDQLIKSRFFEMFGECKTNPKNWKLLNMEDVAVVGSSKRVFIEELQKEGIPFYRGTEVGALAEGKNIVPELYIKENHYKELVNATGIPQPGDLLMPSICPDGRIWVVNTENPFYFKDGRVLWIHNIDTKFNSIFLLYTLKDRIVADYLSIASGTTFAELKIFTLKKCKIFSVPLPLQEQFAAFVQQVDKAKSSVKQSLEKLETLKKSLMQEYFG